MKVLTSRIRENRFKKANEYVAKWLDPSPEEVEQVQLERLQGVWEDAANNVPYYRELVRQGQAPRTFDSIDEFFARVPILTRQQIMGAPERFVREGRPPDRRAMTAGSTGSPIHFGVYKEEAESASVNILVGRIANGLRQEDRLFLLWGHSHLLGTGLRGKGKHVVRKLKDYLSDYRRADAYHLDAPSARSHMRSLLEFRPAVVIGYSSALDMLVKYNRGLSEQVRRLGIKFVVGTAENLPRVDSRSEIEEFFGCPFVMEYGGVEFGTVAHNMPGQPYRIYWWDCVVETLPEAGTAAPDARPVAVTSIYPRYFPLIRYRNGDEIRGAKGLRNGAVTQFSEVCGRHNDAVELSDGSSIHSVGLFHCIHQEQRVYNIQLIVERTELRLLLIAAEADPEIASRIRSRLLDLNPALKACKIEFVTDLVTNRAGKRRWVVDNR